MSLDSKVIWSEGLFLNPQHFQQQERYFERYVNGKCMGYGAYGWGMQSFEIDQQLLKLGKISIINARGIFPDGTPFSFPDQDDAPPVLEVPENTLNKILYLAIPVRRPGAVDVMDDYDSQGLARYVTAEQEARDVTFEGSDAVAISVGKLRMRLLLQGDDLSGYACIGILRIAEARDDKHILLDDEYIPSCFDCSAAQKLTGFISELLGMLHYRGEQTAGRIADVKRAGTAEVADYMMLQLINRLEPMVMHLTGIIGLHPRELFKDLIQVLGEFSTFVTQTKRPPTIPPYLHDDLQATFAPVMNDLRQCLSMVREETAIALTLVEKRYGISVAQITDRNLLGSAMFVLAARADIPENDLRTRLPAQIKIGPVERIRQLVTAALPGIPLKPLAVAPREIPFHSGFSYFELESKSQFWKELHHSGGFAVHVGGNFPGLKLEFWAIRQ